MARACLVAVCNLPRGPSLEHPAVATSIPPHMFSDWSRRVSNAPLFVGAAAFVRLSRAPHFSGGDEHPAVLGQAVCFSGGVKQPAAPVDHLRACLRAGVYVLTHPTTFFFMSFPN